MHSPSRQGPPPLGSLRHMRYREFYPLRPESVPHARQEFRAQATRSELTADIAEAAEICLSELTSNAVRHAKDNRDRRWFHVDCNVLGRYRRYLEIGVHDVDSANIPELPTIPFDPLAAFDDESESGRGLLLVAGLADAVGVMHGPGHNGKVIYCQFILPSPPSLFDRVVRRPRPTSV